MIDTGRLTYLESLKLGHGSHPAPGNGMTQACVMEAVAYIAGEPWSDHPECASPAIASFLRTWNDQLDDDARQMLKPYITRLVGTRTTEADEQTRAWLATDWLARECVPAFLRLAGLTAQAELLEALAPLVSPETARLAQPSLAAARDAARAAGVAAWAAAGDAAWAAAGDAAGDAARDAARAAAGDAARDAARAAARDAARAAGDAAWAAAWDAAGDALAPTVKSLQTSALLLLDRMIEVGR
jgi:hypothetical protein